MCRGAERQIVACLEKRIVSRVEVKFGSRAHWENIMAAFATGIAVACQSFDRMKNKLSQPRVATTCRD